jgi:hypothetical protein
MYTRHEEYSGNVNAGIESAFEHLDDHLRLATHMSKRSWKMGWGKMDLRLDEKHGRDIGAHIVLDGRVFGIHLFLDEVVIERVAPTRKSWETVGEPRLLVVGAYKMGFDLTPNGSGVQLRVSIDYDLPRSGLPHLLGRLFGRSYAKWCTKKMVVDAQEALTTHEHGAQ